MTTTGRRGRLFRRAEDELDEDDADLSDDEHAWWAAREEVAGVPHGAAPDAEEPVADAEAAFSDYWSAESLYDEGTGPKAAPTGPDPSEKPSLDVPGGLDLDSAHLVLQITIGVPWEEITSAHRKLAKLYHPDRLISYSPEAQELGRQRMAEINAAHATLRALHFH